MQNNEIVNRVTSSSLITFDLEQLYQPGARILLDIKSQLYEGLILREKEFRAYVQAHTWEQYNNCFVAVTCSADAIVPTWAYMLLSIALQPHAKKIVFGNLDDLEEALFKESLDAIEWNKFQDAKVVIKGCSKVQVPVAAYVEATNRLRPIASSIMFGEPCSTVPLFKRTKM